MTRDWCVWIPFDDDTAAESAAGCLRIRDLDAKCEGNAVWVYCSARNNPKRLEKEAMHIFRQDGLAGVVAHYPRILRWNAQHQWWADAGTPDRPLPPGELALEPALAPTEARWRVTAVPTTMFNRKRARAQLQLLDRPFLPDDGHCLTLGATDVTDAAALCEAVRNLPAVREAHAEKLSWFERWLLRERYLATTPAETR